MYWRKWTHRERTRRETQGDKKQNFHLHSSGTANLSGESAQVKSGVRLHLNSTGDFFIPETGSEHFLKSMTEEGNAHKKKTEERRGSG